MLGTSSDVPTINVSHLLIYVMVMMTVGTGPTKSLVGIEEKVSRNLLYVISKTTASTVVILLDLFGIIQSL